MIPADVLNTLLEHDCDDLTTDRQAEDEDKVDSGWMDGEEEEEYKVEEHGVRSPVGSIIPNSYSTKHRDSTFSTISSLSTTSKDSMFSTLSVTSESYASSLLSGTSGADSDYFDDSDEINSSSPVADLCSPRSTKSSGRLSQHFYRLFIKPKPKSARSLIRAKSLGTTESKDISVVREKRSNSLPQQVKLRSPEPLLQTQSQTLRHVCFRRRPILSSDEDSKNTTLRVVVFGADHVAGKVARAYNSLRREESACPRLSRVFKLQFYFVPVKRDSAGGLGSLKTTGAVVQSGSPKGAALANVRRIISKINLKHLRLKNPNPHIYKKIHCVVSIITFFLKQGFHLTSTGDSTNDIARLLGMLDPWYERNTLSLLNLPANVVCQVQLESNQTSQSLSNISVYSTENITATCCYYSYLSTVSHVQALPPYIIVNC